MIGSYLEKRHHLEGLEDKRMELLLLVGIAGLGIREAALMEVSSERIHKSNHALSLQGLQCSLLVRLRGGGC